MEILWEKLKKTPYSPLTSFFLHIMRSCDGPHVRDLNDSCNGVISEEILGFLCSVLLDWWWNFSLLIITLLLFKCMGKIFKSYGYLLTSIPLAFNSLTEE